MARTKATVLIGEAIPSKRLAAHKKSRLFKNYKILLRGPNTYNRVKKQPIPRWQKRIEKFMLPTS